ATVHTSDDEAFDIWTKTLRYLPPEKVFRLGDEANFWAPGATGLSGPDSEVFIDNGPQPGVPEHDCNPGENCGRYHEIWNFVFQQYDRKADGTLVPLPRRNIDTGAGLERIAQVLQGVPGDTYRTDLFQPLVKKIESLSGKKYGENMATDVSIRIVAEHSRAAAFLIAQGLTMINEAIARATAQGQRWIDADTAFRLSDTYGFPLEMTKEIATSAGLSVDERGFRELLEGQRSRSRATAKFTQDAMRFGQFYAGLRENEKLRSEFTGYDELQTDGTIASLVVGGSRVEAAHEGTDVEIVLDRT